MSLRPPDRRIVVTSSRNWGNPRRVFGALRRELAGGEFLLAVGDCPTGGDAMAKFWGRKHLMWPVVEFAAPWELRRRAAGPIRNHFMIDMFRPHLVLAFLRPDSKGAKGCADYARGLGIEVIPFYEGFEEPTGITEGGGDAIAV